MSFRRELVFLVALVVMAIALGSMLGCTSLSLEYEHVSHPMAGEPFGPKSEEDWLDQINACGTRTVEISERLNIYGTSCLGYSLTDGGFYGPELTGTLRTGIEFTLQPKSTTHNALGGYRDACGELPGMVGDDC